MSSHKANSIVHVACSKPPSCQIGHADSLMYENKADISVDCDNVQLTDIEQEYINQLSVVERMGYEIAKSLGTSFSLKKSNGFLEWLSRRHEPQQVQSKYPLHLKNHTLVIDSPN